MSKVRIQFRNILSAHFCINQFPAANAYVSKLICALTGYYCFKLKRKAASAHIS